jgi:adenylate cyclase
MLREARVATVRPQRRLAAILAVDVVGYSRLMEADEAGTLARLKTLRSEIIDPSIADHSGRLVKLMGDGALVEFASAVDAVTAAIEIQKAVNERDAGLADDRRIRFRIGINVGDIIVEGDDIYGDGVNVAARIEGLAEPGGIFISRSAADQVRDKVPIRIEARGERTVKNIARPIEVFCIIADRVELAAPGLEGPPAVPAAAPVAGKATIAVLAFSNMSGDAEQEYFSDGISEDIITDLSRLSRLHVIARNSSFAYKQKSLAIPVIARELGVRYVLEGSVRKAGRRVRVTAQLIDAATGGHLWAERYDRDLTDIFEVQDDVRQHIVAALRLTLSEAERSAMAGGGTRDVAAHDHFLKGRELLFGPKRDREIFQRATGCFQQAIEVDPGYAAAYTGLGMAYVLDYQNRWSDAPEASLDEAERLIAEAIVRDEKDPFAHYAAAVAAMWRKDYERWAAEADRALTLNPSYALALNVRGILHIYAGEPARAIPYIEQAIRLDPAQQLYRHFLGTAYFVAGNDETAVAVLKDRIAHVPSADLSRAFLAAALGHLGRLDEARRVWAELMAINPRYSYREHIGRLPFRNAADADRFVDGLRKAGLAT